MSNSHDTAPSIRLGEIALARSGDKGNHANIGVVAYTAAGYDFLRQVLTAERVAAYFSQLGASRVVRYELPRLYALNFVLYDALAGGASRSLRIDTQGKLLGTAILELPLPLPAHAEQMRRTPGPLPPRSDHAGPPTSRLTSTGPAAGAPAEGGPAQGSPTEGGPAAADAATGGPAAGEAAAGCAPPASRPVSSDAATCRPTAGDAATGAPAAGLPATGDAATGGPAAGWSAACGQGTPGAPSEGAFRNPSGPST